ncbi:unnamed protein product [Closterium sp. Naga37s-1]|nr:unnamed protein product [Closterium sp. Naga37s-1]
MVGGTKISTSAPLALPAANAGCPAVCVAAAALVPATSVILICSVTAASVLGSPSRSSPSLSLFAAVVVGCCSTCASLAVPVSALPPLVSTPSLPLIPVSCMKRLLVLPTCSMPGIGLACAAGGFSHGCGAVGVGVWAGRDAAAAGASVVSAASGGLTSSPLMSAAAGVDCNLPRAVTVAPASVLVSRSLSAPSLSLPAVVAVRRCSTCTSPAVPVSVVPTPVSNPSLPLISAPCMERLLVFFTSSMPGIGLACAAGGFRHGCGAVGVDVWVRGDAGAVGASGGERLGEMVSRRATAPLSRSVYRYVYQLSGVPTYLVSSTSEILGVDGSAGGLMVGGSIAGAVGSSGVSSGELATAVLTVVAATVGVFMAVAAAGVITGAAVFVVCVIKPAAALPKLVAAAAGVVTAVVAVTFVLMGAAVAVGVFIASVPAGVITGAAAVVACAVMPAGAVPKPVDAAAAIGSAYPSCPELADWTEGVCRGEFSDVA